jgi:hypothetical protein
VDAYCEMWIFPRKVLGSEEKIFLVEHCILVGCPPGTPKPNRGWPPEPKNVRFARIWGSVVGSTGKTKTGLKVTCDFNGCFKIEGLSSPSLSLDSSGLVGFD